MNEITTSYLAKKVKGNLIGDIKPVKGVFTFLNRAKSGDVVIRHWIDEKGVIIASEKGVSCIITQNPTIDAVNTSKKLHLPIIITSKIEYANAFALKWAVKTFAQDSLRVVVTGTNGKSTTAHMIYTILNLAGYSTYTNTDAKSEFNTLIDPVVAVQIAEFENIKDESIQAMVIEVSEVQGWLDKLMKDHACMMTSAIDPDVLIITNVGLDHIGLVNSIEETFNEIYGSLKAISHRSEQDSKLEKNNLKEKYAILNSDDPLLLKMGELIEKQDNINLLSHGTIANGPTYQNITLKSDGIYHCSTLFMKKEELPFRSKHFLQNTMAAIDACLALGIDEKLIKQGISSYKQLERRFTILSRDPLIIDDFAHNPDGIVATIKSAAKMCEETLCIVFAIRGSRGTIINSLNTEALVSGLAGLNYKIIITSSAEVVDDANTVKQAERDIVLKILKENHLEYVYNENLYPTLEYVLKTAEKTDTILLIGAQGMDPANKLILEINKNLSTK
jgi:UDP-N-acetylmuramoyl-L-alanyl-D-glutamate--2,6-diaminopimelate ligase